MKGIKLVFWTVVVAGFILTQACKPKVKWTDKLSEKERSMLLDGRLVPRAASLADTVVFHVERRSLPNGEALIIQLKPHEGAPCDAPLCGRVIWNDTVNRRIQASPWLVLQNSGDLKFLTADDKAVYTEYFDAAEDQLRYYAYRFADGKTYRTGWISSLYLFRPEKTDWSKGTYTLFSMQEKLELSKRWRPVEE